MGIRSHISFAIIGPMDRLEFLLDWARDLFDMSDLNTEDAIQTYDDQHILRFDNDWLKWYPEYAEVQNFELIWGVAELWGLDGKFVELCWEYFDMDDSVRTINNGCQMKYPQLVMYVAIDPEVGG